jgi:tRNA threonylcarbamoyl adenosine modification protein YeaZ
MREYSDSPPLSGNAPGADRKPLTLALDSGSPQVSLALGRGSEILAESSFPGGPSSPSLLGQLDALLASIDGESSDIGRMIGAQGPGSFTGLRGGLALLLGLSQALGVQATAVPSFFPLAAQAKTPGCVVAAVDALRGEWFTQVFESATGPRCSEPAILTPTDLASWTPCSVVAFGSRPLEDALASRTGFTVQEARPLAPELLRIACDERLQWSPSTLTAPLYLRPPAAAASKPHQSGL